LPGYDKDEQYWNDVEKSLLEKPMYTNDIRRKTRIDNLRINMVKELLFDKFIYMLSEPKIRKTRKTVVKTSGVNIVNTNEVTQPVITTNNIKQKRTTKKSETVILNEVSVIGEVTIKVTNEKKSGKISSEAFIKENGKKIWTYKNDNSVTKEMEIENIIKEIIASGKSQKYLIKLNNLSFVKEYQICLAKYNELTNIAKSNNVNILENAFDNLDTGKLQDMAKMNKFKGLLELKDKFEFELKTK
jgi:hypothetical protein